MNPKKAILTLLFPVVVETVGFLFSHTSITALSSLGHLKLGLEFCLKGKGRLEMLVCLVF